MAARFSYDFLKESDECMPQNFQDNAGVSIYKGLHTDFEQF